MHFKDLSFCCFGQIIFNVYNARLCQNIDAVFHAILGDLVEKCVRIQTLLFVFGKLDKRLYSIQIVVPSPLDKNLTQQQMANMTIDQIELMVKETFDKLQVMKTSTEERLKAEPENIKIKEELELVIKMIEKASELKRITGLKH